MEDQPEDSMMISAQSHLLREAFLDHLIQKSAHPLPSCVITLLHRKTCAVALGRASQWPVEAASHHVRENFSSGERLDSGTRRRMLVPASLQAGLARILTVTRSPSLVL